MSTPYNLRKCLYKRGKFYWVKWYQDGRARYKSTKMTNRELAEEEAEKVILELLRDKGIPSGDILLTDLIDKVDEVLKEQVHTNVIVENTYNFYMFLLETIRKEMGSYYISQITVEDIEMYLKKRREQNNLSISTMRHEHLTWNKIHKYAVDRGYCK